MQATITPSIVVLLALAVVEARAQALPQQQLQQPTQQAPVNAAAELDPVVVTATRAGRQQLDVPASVDVVTRDALRDTQPRVNLSESLSRVPGLVVLDRQNYAQDLQISIRGFGARSTFGVRGVRLYVDGVPASFPDGQGQVSHFPLNAAERIEVLRGPFSALYGNSSGGVIALTTELKPQDQRVEASALLGADNTWRLGLNAAGGVDPYVYALDANRFRTGGSREHSAARRDTVQLRTAFLDSPLGRARINLNVLDMPDAQDPLGLTRAQFNSNPRQAAPQALQFNTRKSTRQLIASTDVQSQLAASTTLSTIAWIGTREVTQFQAIPTAVQASATHPGGVIDFDRRFGGTDLRVSVDGDNWTAHAGLSAELLDEDRRGYENFSGSDLGVQGRLRRDEDNRVSSIDPYLQGEWRPTEQWRAHAGLRASEVRVRSRDAYINGANGDDSGSTRFRALTPTAGLVYKPMSRLSLYSAFGRGFETPTLNELAYRADGSAGLNTELRAARSNNFEFGIKAAPTDWLRANAALFTVRTRDDIVVRSNTGGRSAFGNAARTRREGAELGLEIKPNESWSLVASLAWIRARFDRAFLTCTAAPCATPTVPVAAGTHLPGVPARSAFMELKYRAGWADLSAEWRGQSRIYVNDINAETAPGYGLVNLAIARSFRSERPIRVFLRLNNALDQRYAGSVIVNEGNSRFYEPAPGRSWFAGVDWQL